MNFYISRNYNGVCWHKRLDKWLAYISIDNKRHHLGYYVNDVEAAEAFDVAAVRKNAFNHILNFPEKLPNYNKFIAENGREFTIFKEKSPIKSGHKNIICDKKSETKFYWKCTLPGYRKSFPYTSEGLEEAIKWRDSSYVLIHGETIEETINKRLAKKAKKPREKKQHIQPTLQDLLNMFYIKDSILMRKTSINNYIVKDTPAGNLDKSDGYYETKINGKSYSNHRIMYQMYHNLENLPDDLVIDHRDRNRSNNSIENLHLVDSYENAHNLSKDPRNTSGYTGASWHRKIGKWQAYITIEYNKIYLGYYDNLIEAAKAYDIAALRRDNENHVLNFPENKEAYLKYIEENGKEISEYSYVKSEIQSGHEYIYFDGGSNRKSYWRVKMVNNHQKYYKTFPFTDDGLSSAIEWRNATYERLYNRPFSE